MILVTSELDINKNEGLRIFNPTFITNTDHENNI